MTTTKATELKEIIVWLDFGIDNETLINTKSGQDMLVAIREVVSDMLALGEAYKDLNTCQKANESLHGYGAVDCTRVKHKFTEEAANLAQKWGG